MTGFYASAETTEGLRRLGAVYTAPSRVHARGMIRVHAAQEGVHAMEGPPVEFLDALADLTSHHIEGIAVQGGTPFEAALISHVEGNLWQGGTPADVLGTGARPLPFFRYVLNLYPWVRYPVDPALTEVREERLYDHGDVPDEAVLEDLAAWVNDRREKGPTLVHCQAGLNRSALVTALALIREGRTPDAAIRLLREKRSPAVLCNAAFERWLRTES